MSATSIRGTGIVRFTSTPRGGARLDIREQWIGVEVPCLFLHDGTPRRGESIRDVKTGLDVPDYPGYVVLQTDAIEALRKKAPKAAEYWGALGFPNHNTALFLFDLGCAEVVTPVLTREEFWQQFPDF